MARIPVTRSLPPLTKLAAAAQRLQPKDNFSQHLYELLRQTVLRARRADSHPFYSVREVARAFQLHHSTVADVYARLEKEGLLVRVRGTKTLIAPQPRRAKSQQVVGIPVWLPGLRWLPEWRLFFVYFQEELSRHGAVADFIFFRQGQEVEPAFAARVKAHRPDVVFWLEPHPTSDRQAMYQLTDAGLPLVTVRDRPAAVPGYGYWTEKRAAYEQGLREWQAAGIRSIQIVSHDRSLNAPVDLHLQEALATVRIHCSFPVLGQQSPEKFLRSLARKNSGVIWEESLVHFGLCCRAPEAMTELYRATRVMLTRSRMLPVELPADVRVDALHLDCRALAERIARDIASGDVFERREPELIHVEWRSRLKAATALAEGEGL